MKNLLFTTLALISITYFSAPVVFAQTETPCGNIITPADFYDEGSEEESDPIQNCDNPLERTGDLETFKLNNQTVVNNSTYAVSEEGVADYGFDDATQSVVMTYRDGNGVPFLKVQAKMKKIE